MIIIIIIITITITLIIIMTITRCGMSLLEPRCTISVVTQGE